VLLPGAVTQGGDDVVEVDPAPGDRVGELVEDVQVVRLDGEAALDLLPSLGCGPCVVLGVALLLRPGPARAHLVPLDRSALATLLVQATEALEDGLLPDAPLGGLHELEDAYV